VTAVRGNIDARAPDLPDVVTLDIRDASGTLLKILLVHIAVNGVKVRADVARFAQAEGASIVVCGHSHGPLRRARQGAHWCSTRAPSDPGGSSCPWCSGSST
jgi:predicted phosphodiesterase